jgi:hypothetical protein
MSVEPRMKSVWSRLEPRVRLRLTIALSAVAIVVGTFAACGGCGKRLPPGGDPTIALAGDAAAPAARELRIVDAATLRDPSMWERAKDGDAEDLAALAVHEGASGLIEGASEPSLRPTALRALGFARGFAQLPFLAKVASGKDEQEAMLALDATVELATRPRRAEDPEDAEELREGCEGLVTLAHDAKAARKRRILAIRALRMMACSAKGAGEGLPHDVDTK